MFSSLIPGLRPPQPSPSPASVTSATADGTSIAPSSSSRSSATATSPAPTVTASSPGLPSTATPSSSSVSPHPNLTHTRSTSRATTASTSLNLPGIGPGGPVSSQRQIEEARNAVVASIGNLLDRELQGRAALLHANNAAIEKQERDVARARDALRRENDKLQKLATENARKVKEIGNVQNWAEMLEREFLIVEETLRLGREVGVVDGMVVGEEGVVAPEMMPIPESPPPGVVMDTEGK
ncbi:hypothetical protein B0T16DRAFT_83343 [Cercophora newfieldiana]|uniref:Biogenesis of lysosome-related organelles complex 1 subunit 1 n=1 Tax=Cercophora newfieldiana TaxID=92897 RepID=A0AA39YFD3_9PEZI|nr:hypothetical protein B0T16DRAFT_83343 [Cercophora newfieldiana]